MPGAARALGLTKPSPGPAGLPKAGPIGADPFGVLSSPRWAKASLAPRHSLSPSCRACGQRDALPLHRVLLARQNLEECVLSVPPKADIEPLATQPQISQCHVRQPIRQRGIDIELAARRVLLQPQHRLQQHKRRSRRPGLWYVGAQILHGETRGVALQPAIKLRQLIQQEMACSAADVTSHRRRLCGKSVAPHAERDQRVVMRPHRPSLIVVWIERRMIRR